jgi:hypothetical protein
VLLRSACVRIACVRGSNGDDLHAPCVFSQHHDLAAVEAIVKDVFERFDEGKKGHLSKEDFAKWTADQPVVDEVGQPALHSTLCTHSTPVRSACSLPLHVLCDSPASGSQVCVLRHPPPPSRSSCVHQVFPLACCVPHPPLALVQLFSSVFPADAAAPPIPSGATATAAPAASPPSSPPGGGAWYFYKHQCYCVPAPFLLISL